MMNLSFLNGEGDLCQEFGLVHTRTGWGRKKATTRSLLLQASKEIAFEMCTQLVQYIKKHILNAL